MVGKAGGEEKEGREILKAKEGGEGGQWGREDKS